AVLSASDDPRPLNPGEPLGGPARASLYRGTSLARSTLPAACIKQRDAVAQPPGWQLHRPQLRGQCQRRRRFPVDAVAGVPGPGHRASTNLSSPGGVAHSSTSRSASVPPAARKSSTPLPAAGFPVAGSIGGAATYVVPTPRWRRRV